MKKHIFFAADIGGTKTHVGIFQSGHKKPRPIVIRTYSSKQWPSIEGIVRDFLSHSSHRPEVSCLAIAGPVIGGRAKTTNLPWVVSEPQIRKTFGWKRVKLINDLVAAATSIPLLRPSELYLLNNGTKQKTGTMGLLAPGTGLGQAMLIKPGTDYFVISSEGGHCDFAPTNEEQLHLWHFLYNKYGHVSIERLLSGPGMLNIYMWLKESGRYKEPRWLQRTMAAVKPANMPRIITEAALDRGTPICKATVKNFTVILGSVCGNLALTAMATGGIYLGGGIPPKILPFLRQPDFLKAFTNKGRFAELLAKIPIQVILNEKAPLLGAARVASTLI